MQEFAGILTAYLKPMILSAHYLKPGCHQLVARLMERMKQRDDKMGAVAEMTCDGQNNLWDVNKHEMNSQKCKKLYNKSLSAPPPLL